MSKKWLYAKNAEIIDEKEEIGNVGNVGNVVYPKSLSNNKTYNCIRMVAEVAEVAKEEPVTEPNRFPEQEKKAGWDICEHCEAKQRKASK